MNESQKYLDEVLEPLYQQAAQVIKLKRDAIADDIKKKAKASSGPFTKKRKALKAQAELAKKTLRALPNQVTSDDQVIDALSDSREYDLPEINESEFLESSGFINYLIKTADISKTKAEKIWDNASGAFSKNDKYNKITGDKKYKIISGIAKKMANITEDGEIGASMGYEGGGLGSAANTTQSIGGTFASVLGTPVNEPGKYKPDSSKLFQRNKTWGKKKKKKLKENTIINQYIDNLFE